MAGVSCRQEPDRRLAHLTSLLPPATYGAGVARVVVVGGGFAGMACAVRVAAQRHAVVLIERSARPGGRLLPVSYDGFTWDRTTTSLALPAVVRDLFGSTGPPLERSLTLEPLPVLRRHVFAPRDFPEGDGLVMLDLPGGARAAQTDAVDAALGGRRAGAPGTAWSARLDQQRPVWDVLRQQVLERPFTGRGDLDRRQWRALAPRRSLHRSVRALRDDRLRALVLDRFVLAGQDPRAVPAALGVADLIERAFGRWRPVGGVAALADALTERLAYRRVDVRCGTDALDVAYDRGRVSGVLCADGQRVPADVVVWAAPQPPPSLADRGPATPALPAARTYVGLRCDGLPELPAETFVHGDPLVLVRTGGTGPDGCTGWSLEHHAGPDEVLASLARRCLDVRAAVMARLDVSPAEVVRQDGGSPAGMRWQGWRSGLARPTVTTAVPGLLRAGPGVHPGPGIVAEGLGAAQVAMLIGSD